jgi:hypothetical protein
MLGDPSRRRFGSNRARTGAAAADSQWSCDNLEVAQWQ